MVHTVSAVHSCTRIISWSPTRSKKSEAPWPWFVETEAGFWWLPHRLRHDIEVLRVDSQGGERLVCRSTFTIARNPATPAHALAAVNYLNQRGLGASAYFDFEANEMKMVTSTDLSGAGWFNVFLFEGIVGRLVGILEIAAERLAGAAGAEPAFVEHPHLGPRLEPDQFISDAAKSTYGPEAGTGFWWSRKEVADFRNAWKFFMEQGGRPDLAETIDPEEYDPRLTSARNLEQHSMIDIDAGDIGIFATRISVQPAEHHEIGSGLEFLLATDITFGGERDPAKTPDNSFDSLNVANTLNSTAAATCAPTLLAGGWSVWRGQLSLSTWIQPEDIRMLQGTAALCCGAVIAVMSNQHHTRFGELLQLLRGPLGVEWDHADEFAWDGVRQNAGKEQLLIDSQSVTNAAIQGLPVNELFEPITLDNNCWLLQHEVVPLRFGIFNPAGPSVGTIEVAIDYGKQIALLLERCRHPFSPSLRLYAVLDLDGFHRLGEFLAQMIPTIPWSSLDWVDVNDEDPKVREEIFNGLIAFAQSRDFDFLDHAAALLETTEDPWIRVDPGFETTTAFGADATLETSWVPAVTSAANIDAHLAYLRSAWEGAQAYKQSGFDPQAATDMMKGCRSEIDRRGGTSASS